MKQNTNLRDIVLLVDDSPEALGFLTKALDQAGVTVLVATSGQAALSIVAKVTPDVILMDAVMPEIDGFETCTKIKGSSTLRDVPVIFMTGLSETEHVVHALECGGVDFLTKPINLDELQARIRVHLANARTVRSARIALDATGRHLVAAGTSGEIFWTTPQTQQMLERFHDTAGAEETLGRALSAWLNADAGSPNGNSSTFPVTLPHNVRLQIQYLGAIGPQERPFRLSPANGSDQDKVLHDHFGLTTRESEVLCWIAKGKTNRDIGDILGLSPRTVNKHLEQIYVKLGVENRASAAVRAAQVLHEI